MTAVQLQSIVTSLDTYRTQFAALGHALSALRVVSDQMIAQLDKDRDALATHLQAALDSVDAEVTAAATHHDVESAVECDADHVAGTGTGVATELQSEAPAQHDFEIELVAALGTHAETAAVSIEEQASSEVDALPSLEVMMHAEIDTEDSNLDHPSRDAVDTEPAAEANSAEATIADDESNVVSLVARRQAKASASPARRRAMAVIASILVTATATMGLHELMQSELGHRLLELGTCDGDMLSATRDCSLLSWLLI